MLLSMATKFRVNRLAMKVLAIENERSIDHQVAIATHKVTIKKMRLK